VLGAEIDAGTLMDKLAGAMPAEVNPAEGYVFRDPTGRVIHQVGSVPVGAPPSSVVPVDATLLPGWTVAGFLDVDSSHGPFGPALFWTAVLLLAVFIAAILAGGSLLRAQARRSDAEAAQKTSFVANVSHEFKTPLTTIRLYAELLEQNRVRNAEQGAEYLRTIGRESQRLTRLVNNVLDFSRLEQGRKKFRCEPIDLVAELNTLLDCHGPRLTEAGLRLDRRLPDGRVDVVTDRDALAQVMLNLLDNACKYAAQAGTVEVTLATMPSDRVELRVADRGPGVPADQRELIFEKFHRVDDALTAEKTGAGLGLSIARQLARGLGGDLRCVARAGGGAEFVLDLPSPPTKSLS
jgi:signal transduction histidine kinase